jgi:Flp pilus assembly protein TadG
MRRVVHRTCYRLLPQKKHWHRSAKPECWREEQGATVVEMALSVMILLTVLFGLIEICLALYTYHYVSDAAREGTRYAIVHGAACTTVSGVSCTATSDQIQTYVQDLGYPGINPSNITVTTTWSAYPVGGACNAAGCNGPGDLATVMAQYNFLLSIPFTTATTLNLTSTSSMVISQ